MLGAVGSQEHRHAIVDIGLDVENTQYHGSAFNKDDGEVIKSHRTKHH